jgi:hypothetical protein
MPPYQSVALAFRAVEQAVDKVRRGTASYLALDLALADLADELYALDVPVCDLTDEAPQAEADV